MGAWGAGAAVVAGVAPVLYADVQIRRLETLDPVRDAPGGAHVDVEGIAIHYEAAGSGPPMVLIHGFGGSTYSWRFNLEYFARSYRTYALDLPGFGYSGRTTRPVFSRQAQARIVAGFLCAMGETEPAVIIGHSLGGGVALRYAMDYRAYTRALILSAPAVYWNPRWRRAARFFQVPVIGRSIVRSIYYYGLARPRSLERMLEGAYGSKVDMVSAEMRDSMFGPIHVRGTADSALGLVRSHDDRPLTELLDRVLVPVLIVAGRQDRAIPVHYIRRLDEVLPNSRLAVVDDAGHLVHEEASDEFNELARAFLAKGAARSGMAGG